MNVQVEHYMISHSIIDEGASISILSTCDWRGMGSPSLMSIVNQPLGLNRRPSQNLGGNTILVYFMVIEDSLDFNMILKCDYVYAMKFLVSMLFHVVYFPHNESTLIVNQLEFVDTSPYPTVDQVYPLLIPSVSIDTTHHG